MKRLSAILLFTFICSAVFAQADTTAIRDTVAVIPIKVAPVNIYKSILESNIFLNSKALPVSLNVHPRNNADNSIWFYIMLGLVLLPALLKTIFNRYFTTLFRVFFNSSLRQTQLTDQLEQATLPSLLFNLFFVITGGLYVYLLLMHFKEPVNDINLSRAAACIGAVAVCYIVKFLSLKFTGWVTSYKKEADVYIFIVFLLNKILSIFLLPLMILMIFSPDFIASFAVYFSFFVIGILFLMRFYRAFSLLENQLKVSRFHFLLYIIAFEIIPPAVIYKFATLFVHFST